MFSLLKSRLGTVSLAAGVMGGARQQDRVRPGRAQLAAPLLLAALLAAHPTGALAQRAEPDIDFPTWTGELTGVAANALLGGLTAGLMQRARGGSFADGFTRGAAGGAVVYGGKRLAVERFSGAGLAGREVAAVGASVIRNAAEGRPSFERVMLPAGPVRLYLTTGDRLRVRAKLDLVTLAAAGYAVATPELEWDAGGSLSTGAPVFRVRNLLLQSGHEKADEIGASGITRAGTIYLSELAGLDYAEDFAHERVHLVQYDQIFWTWTAPAEEWLLERVPGGSWLGERVDLNLSPLVTRALALTFKRYERRPWELEAEFLARKQ